jgi:hypothetical protein
MKVYFAAATAHAIDHVIMVMENGQIAQRTDPNELIPLIKKSALNRWVKRDKAGNPIYNDYGDELSFDCGDGNYLVYKIFHLEIPTEKVTVDMLLHSMKNEEIGKLYTALLRIDEVNLLGDGLLKELWLRVKDECEAR